MNPMGELHSATPSDPIGAIVESAPVERPRRTVLAGKIVSLVPVDAEAHARLLYEKLHGADRDRLWLYMSEGPYADFASFQEKLAQKAASDDPFFFTIVDNASGDPAGWASYLRIDPAHRTIEVGNIVYSPSFQKTPGATEAMYLMALHAFEELGYRRYEWKCNAFNERSRRAALRLGFTFEGVFRQHMIIKGRNRDTAWFSMLDSEWPLRKAAFERWLHPSNFDSDGRQIKALSAFRVSA